jgi:hypothetical protein
MDARDDIIQTTEQEYAALRALLQGLDEASMREVWLGTWGVREIVAHISGWHREMLPAVERLARGESPYPDGSYDDFDRWNAHFVAERKDVATRDLLAEMDRSHADFVGAARRLAPADLAEGGKARSLVDGVGAGHYREHSAQIGDWRRRSTR